MKKGVKKRVWPVLGLAAIAGAIALLIGAGLSDNMVYFLTPSELQARSAEVYGSPLRLGGQVKPRTIDWDAERGELRFTVTDGTAEIPVHSEGAPPAMFADDMGVVVEGIFHQDGVFRSRNVMVKHSNEYRPPAEGEDPHRAYRSLIPEGED